MTPAEKALLLFGTDEPVVSPRRLVAGALSADLDRGNLRYLRWGGLEVIRGIAFTLRDTNWSTYQPVISDLVVKEEGDKFSVAYVARCDGTEGDFQYRATIAGHADGRLVFTAAGTSDTGFRTCRTGFVVLHPLDGVVGRQVAVEHASGGRSLTVFPELISADQPIFDIRELAHEPKPGLGVKVRLEGETFEMEDHRNWTDASFKTYSRPLARGFPYSIVPGQRVEQTVSLVVAGTTTPAQVQSPIATVSLGGLEGAVPRLGLYAEPADLAAAAETAPRLAAFKPSYLIGRVDCRGRDAVADLGELVELAKALGCPLALQAVIRGAAPQSELAALARRIRQFTSLDSIHVIPARDLKSRPSNTVPDGEVDAAAILAAARRCFPGCRIGGGMPVPFAELNRNRPAPGIDFATHATQAVVHAADDLSVMETLTVIPVVIRSVRNLVGDIAYRLGPSTIGVPAITAPSSSLPNPGRTRMTMAADDPRQQALFGAAFSLGLAAIAGRESVEGLTFAAAAGPAGLLRADGTHSPSTAIFEELAALAGRARIDTAVQGSDNLQVLAAEAPDGPRLLMSNCGESRITARIVGHDFLSARLIDAAALMVGSVDRIGYGPAGTSIELDGYATAILR